VDPSYGPNQKPNGSRLSLLLYGVAAAGYHFRQILLKRPNDFPRPGNLARLRIGPLHMAEPIARC